MDRDQFEVALELAATENAQLRTKIADLEERNALHMELANQQNERNKERADEAERLVGSVIPAPLIHALRLCGMPEKADPPSWIVDLGAWKTAVIDACVVSWASWDLNDPRATLRALIAQEVSTALDPLVSQAAADLMARGRRVGLDVAIGIVKEMDEWDAGLVEDLELARDEPSK